MNVLLSHEPRIVSAGVELFADSLRRQAASVSQVDWRPPMPGTEEDLAAVLGDPRRMKANESAIDRVTATNARLVDVLPAGVALGIGASDFLHAGPPIEWEEASGPLRGALMGAAVLEGLADTPEAAEKMLSRSRGITLEPCHHHRSVGPMAGVISSTMWLFVLEDQLSGRRAYCSLNEGLGKVLRYGAYSADVLERLNWMSAVLGPTLQVAIQQHGPVDITTILAQMLHMGDEGHNRNRSGTLLFIRELLPTLLTSDLPSDDVVDCIKFMSRNDHFFLNLAMPACKVALDGARDIPGSTLVVAMARNGTDFGIQVSGTGDEWFTGPAQFIDGLLFGGYEAGDANPDIGDSTIVETAGLGGFAMAAAPAIVSFVGGTADLAVANTLRMYEIALTEHPLFTIPILNFRGSPCGIDVTKVVRTGILPQINTGIAGRVAGTGQIGAGLVTPPSSVFPDALRGLANAVR